MSARLRAAGTWLIVIVAAAAYIATRGSVNADFSAFLPDAASTEQRFLVSELKDGVASRLLLIEISGAAPERLADASRALAVRLAADPQFRYVNNGDVGAGGRDFDVLRSNRYLLSDAVTPERFTVGGLRSTLAARLVSLSSGAGLVEKSLLAADPTGETMHVVAQLAPSRQPRREHGVWFDQTGTRALLLAQTSAAGSDLDGQTRAVAALERAFAAARDGSAAAIRYSSPGAMAVQSRSVIAGDASRLAIVSTLLVIAILLFVYRSPRVVLFCALPAATGLVVGVAAVDIAFGAVHAITLGFGATLLGEAVDYPSYLLTQMHPGESARDALARIGRTLALAVLTTAAAASALLVAGFSGLAQLGTLTLVGVVVAGVVTAWVLPYWVPAGWTPPAMRMASPRSIPRLGPRGGVAIAVALTIALLALAARNAVWDDDLSNMNPLPRELRNRDRELRAALGAPEVRYMLLVEAPTRDAALSSAERLRPALSDAVRAGALAGFELVSDYMPSTAMQRRRQQSLPDDAELRQRFEQAASGTPFRVDAFEPFFADVARARTTPPLDERALAGSALAVKSESLLRASDGHWYAIVPLAGVARPEDVETTVARAGIDGVRSIDLQAASRAMMADFRHRALAAFGLGAALIVTVVGVGMRSAAAALRIGSPPLAAVVATGAAMVAFGSPLSVFHLVASMLVAGIGTNYALFVARASSHGDAPAAIARSLAVVVGTTLCAFGTLATSRTPVLHAIGLTVVVGVVLSLVYTLLLPVRDARASPMQ